MALKKNKIIILGGGTSGWLTAAMIKKYHGDTVSVSLISPRDNFPIGVGEATVPTLINILKFLGIPEAEIFRSCQGTFKLAIRFEGWRQKTSYGQTFFYHPFGHMPKRGNMDLSEYWLQGHLLGLPHSFAEATSMIPHFCKELKAPKTFDSEEFNGYVEYAYHLDASLLGRYLKNYCLNIGVEHLETEITHVQISKSDKKHITALQSSTLGPLEADLYVDCSGFKSLLLGQGLQEPFHSYLNSLPCDHAWATHLPYPKDQTIILNYTTARAMNGGWAWNIPLQNRAGVGYVYSSSHLSDEAALSEFQNQLGPEAHNLDFQKISIRAGRHERAWVGNCVAVGLAGGFVEPLESSGLAFIYTTVQAILPHIIKFNHSPHGVESFNIYIAELYDLIRDFLILHYCTTDRRDTAFWQTCVEDLYIPPSLEKKLELWKKYLPTEAENQALVNFNNYNVLCVLAGMDYLPSQAKPGFQEMSSKELSSILSKLKQKARSFADHLPAQREYLSQFQGPQRI